MEDTTLISEIKVNQSRCKDDTERYERYLARHKRYNSKLFTCELCSVVISIAGKARHFKSKKHMKKLEAE